MKSKIPLLFLLGLILIFVVFNTRGPGSSLPAGARSSLTSSNELRAVESPSLATPRVLITKVVDGDTVDILINGQKDVVRLIGINAPEVNQCFGKEATDRAKEILSSKEVILESDSSQDDRDKYHRLLRYVFIDGINFDEEMIKEGYAREYTFKIPYKYQSDFKKAQNEAQANKKGLWADEACK